MKLTTRKLVVTGVLAALIIIFGFTPIGYIPIPPVKITLLCLPVIIGVIMEGFLPGLILSLFFIGTSFAQLFMGDPFMVIFNQGLPYALLVSVIIVVPRLLVPVVTWLVYRAVTLRNSGLKRAGTGAGVAALAGSLTNTIFFLGLTYLLIGDAVMKLDAVQSMMPNVVSLLGQGGILAFVCYLAITNGLPEAVFTILVTIPVVVALKRIYGKANIKPQRS